MTYRLVDDIARRRIFYSPPVPTVPAVVVIDIAADHRGAGLSLGRYYAIFVENELERDELERFLTAARKDAVPPDLLDRRQSSLRTDQVLLIRYDPPAPDWPWLSVCRWPGSKAPDATSRNGMARGCYTMEMFSTAATLEEHQSMLLSALMRDRTVDLRIIAGDRLPVPGIG